MFIFIFNDLGIDIYYLKSQVLLLKFPYNNFACVRSDENKQMFFFLYKKSSDHLACVFCESLFESEQMRHKLKLHAHFFCASLLTFYINYKPEMGAKKYKTQKSTCLWENKKLTRYQHKLYKLTSARRIKNIRCQSTRGRKIRVKIKI